MMNSHVTKSHILTNTSGKISSLVIVPKWQLKSLQVFRMLLRLKQRVLQATRGVVHEIFYGQIKSIITPKVSNGFDTSQGMKSAKPLIQHSLTLCSKVAATIDQAQVGQKYLNETRDILPKLGSCLTWHIKFRLSCKSKLISTCRCTAHLTETHWRSKCILKNSISQCIIWY